LLQSMHDSIFDEHLALDHRQLESCMAGVKTFLLIGDEKE